MSVQTIGWVLLGGLVLGSSAVMMRFGLREISPLWLVALRLVVATLALGSILAALRRNLPRDGRAWLDIAIIGVLNTGAPLLAFTLALQGFSAGVLSIFITLVPLLTAVLAHLWLAGEKLNVTKLLGLLLALAGVGLLIVTRTNGLAGEALDLRGLLLTFGGVVTASVGLVYARRRVKHLDVLVVTTGQTAVALVLAAPVALAFSPLDLAAIAWQGWVAVLYTGLFSSAAGFLIMFLLVQRFGATIASLPGYIMPVVATALGALFLGEVVTLPMVSAGVLVLGGVFLAGRDRPPEAERPAEPTAAAPDNLWGC